MNYFDVWFTCICILVLQNYVSEFLGYIECGKSRPNKKTKRHLCSNLNSYKPVICIDLIKKTCGGWPEAVKLEKYSIKWQSIWICLLKSSESVQYLCLRNRPKFKFYILKISFWRCAYLNNNWLCKKNQ